VILAGPGATRRLRILQVVPTYYPAVRYGGPIRSVHGLSVALARRGHDVHVFTTNMDGPGDLDVPTDRRVDLDGVSVRYFPVPALRRLAWSPAMGRELNERVAEFDVVHLHSAFLWPTRAAARAAVRAGVPYLLAPRGMLIRDVIQRRSRGVKRAWIALVERRTLAEAAGLHATAQIEIDEARALGLTVRRSFSVANGVEWPARPRELAETPYAALSPTFALFLSRISWKKGIDRLIQAWKFVPDLPLIIGGNDDEGLIPGLTELARREGVANRVRFIGAVSDADKWALYRAARLTVLPSWSENFGNVIAEAMAMSCPVVLTRGVGIAPLVERYGAGLVCGNEPHDIAEAVLRVVRNPAAGEMGLRGRVAAETELSWPAIAVRMESAYLSIIAPHRVTAPAVAAHSAGGA
jgi:glycosyltransferase involved in cell wall biosynthesis